MTYETARAWAEHVVVISSVLSILLPPIETFSQFPVFQKWYGMAVIVITRWASLNLRNVIYWKKFNTQRPDPAPGPTEPLCK